MFYFTLVLNETVFFTCVDFIIINEKKFLFSKMQMELIYNNSNYKLNVNILQITILN